MSTFLYYFPGSGVVPSGQLEKVPEASGLRPLLEGANWSFNGDCRGPDDKTGCLISIHPAPGSGGTETLGYYEPAAQTWRKVQPQADSQEGTYWMGWLKAARPTPADLSRGELVDGLPVELRGGHEWMVPIVHVRWTTLPRRFFYDAERGAEPRIEPRYDGLCALTERWVERILQNRSYTYADAYDYLWRLLSVNYRVGPWECDGDCLDLFDTNNLEEPILVATGVRSFEAQKKMEIPSSGGATSPGAAA